MPVATIIHHSSFANQACYKENSKPDLQSDGYTSSQQSSLIPRPFQGGPTVWESQSNSLALQLDNELANENGGRQQVTHKSRQYQY